MAKKKTNEIKAPKKAAKEVPQEAPKKKKKKHTGLKVFAILMTIFVVFPIAFVFIAFFDTSTKKVTDTKIHYENIVSETFYKALGNLSTGSLEFTINEEMIDGIMALGCDKINQKQFIPKMYCYIHKNNYDFVVDLQASFFKTRVQLKTSLTSDEDTILTFKINQIVIGRLPIPVNWITGIAGNFIKDDMLNNIFEQSGFRIKCHLAQAKLTYAKEDFREDVAGYVEKLANNNEYLQLVFDVLGTCSGDDDLIKTEYNNGVTAAIDLTKLKIPDISSKLPLKFPELNEHKEKITKWLNDGILEEEKVADIFSYLVRGYNRSSDTAKTFIDTIDEAQEKPAIYDAIKEYVAVEPKEYEGSYVNDTKTTRFEAYCDGGDEITVGFQPQFEQPTRALSLNVTLQENALNKYLAYNMYDAIGKTIPVTYKDADNKWGFEYIVIDNFFIDFQQSSNNSVQMNMYLSINIAGLPICLEVINSNIRIEGSSSASFGKLAFDLSEINFGLIPVKDAKILDTVLGLIPASDTFTYIKDDKNGYFAINLDKLLAGSDYDNPTDKGLIAQLIEGREATSSIDKDATGDILKLGYSLGS